MTNPAFAVLGAAPAFDAPLPVGQLYFPEWPRYEKAMRGIFERQYYNNNGPLLTELEGRLREFLGVRHAICVANATFGLMMIPEAMGLTGEVILPSFTFIASPQSLSWAGVKPRFCDVNPITHQIDVEKLTSLVEPSVTAIMGVNLWGGACDIAALEDVAKMHGLHLYFDSAHAFGCEVDGRRIGGFGDAEVFSFHATKILGATEGGCITTNDDALAARLRAIRPSYGEENPVKVEKAINARMSEAQAAIALMNLDDFAKNRQNNEEIFHLYQQGLQGVPGVKLIQPSGVSLSNYQYIVCEINEAEYGLSRDTLLELLKAENILARRYFYPGAHRTLEYADESAPVLPVTDALCARCLQLPVGAMVDARAVQKISQIIADIHTHAPLLRQAVKGTAS